MNTKESLEAWIARIRALSATEMDLSLERVYEIGANLGWLTPSCPVITVAGTNGKGSTVKTLEKIYDSAGYRVGVFTSPYLYRYNEQFRIQTIPASDALICSAFEQIQDACGLDRRLTLFEYAALAAFKLFNDAALDVWILEVGLGGRWDATNVIDADVAVVTSIGIDHAEWLGDTRELIAREKAGIFRKNRPAVCGDFFPPQSLLEEANKKGAILYCQNIDFCFFEQHGVFAWQSKTKKYETLPISKLALQNVSTALMAVELLQDKLPVTESALHLALADLSLPGRRQVISREVMHILDVAHNPAAVEHLVEFLGKHPVTGHRYAVFSMLADKDIVQSIAMISPYIKHWYVAPLQVERGASMQQLSESFRQAGVDAVSFYHDIPTAYAAAYPSSTKDDCLLVFGSFRVLGQLGEIVGVNSVRNEG